MKRGVSAPSENAGGSQGAQWTRQSRLSPPLNCASGGGGGEAERCGRSESGARVTDSRGESPPSLWPLRWGRGGADVQEDAVMGPRRNNQSQTTHLCFSPRVPREQPKDPHRLRCASLTPNGPCVASCGWASSSLRVSEPPRDFHEALGAPGESCDRGGIWDPEVLQEEEMRRVGRKRGRGRLGDVKDGGLGLGVAKPGRGAAAAHAWRVGSP